jgi:hypothetical protein
MLEIVLRLPLIPLTYLPFFLVHRFKAAMEDFAEVVKRKTELAAEAQK